jgi:hypothetical protein
MVCTFGLNSQGVDDETFFDAAVVGSSIDQHSGSQFDGPAATGPPANVPTPSVASAISEAKSTKCQTAT